ncbi:MAG: MotE family protein [Hyphomicrobiaceae bacterium]
MNGLLKTFDEASNRANAVRILGYASISLFICLFEISSKANAQSAFPQDVWAAELIEIELPRYQPKKSADKPNHSSDEGGGFDYSRILLPVRNPKRLILKVKAPAETMITTGGIKKKNKARKLELPKTKIARDYCISLTDDAKNARLEWQKRDLEKVKKQVEASSNELKKKISELEKWFDRRSMIAKDYEKRLQHIYKQMQPDNAANQLGAMKTGIAKNILLQLGPSEAAAILDEMEPTKAAALTSFIAMEARNFAKQSKAAKALAGNLQ